MLRSRGERRRREGTDHGTTKSGKPNILVIWGDDIGQSNLSCYTHGLMGYRTPNIDRIAREGMLFTDSYGEQSCTAGRSAFITGQSVYRTGLSKVGIPALRFDNWKIVFMEQRMEGTMGVWAEPFVRLRLPKLYNLRTDPYEFATVTSNSYWDWMVHNAYFIFAAQAAAAKFADTFKEFPAVQRPNSFTIDDAMAKISAASSGAS